MINLLIDTCSWQNILTDRTSNKGLDYLIQLCDSNQVRLITHEKIIEEWDRNKKKEKVNLSKAVQARFRHYNEVSVDNEFPALIDEPSTQHIDEQIKAIDKLLSGAIQLSTNDDIKIICSDKAAQKKAPFLNNPDSNSFNDAYIIYSALEYFTRISEEFVFVSNNKNDFSDSKSRTRDIHPDIIEDYSADIIDYYIEIENLFYDLKERFGLKEPASSSDLISRKGDKPLIDTSKPKHEQLYNYLKLLYREFRYIPIHILLKNAPFKTNQESPFTYYSLFTIYISDNKLFETFNEIISVDDNLDINLFDNAVDTDGAKFIRKTLSNNLIYSVAHRKSKNQPIELRFNDHEYCDCPKCCLKRLDFTNFFKNIDEFNDTPQDLIEQAYLFHKIGNFIGAVDNLERAYQKSRENKNLSYAFVSKFNLSKLWPFIGSLWYDIPNGKDISEKLKKINITSEAISCRTQENHEIIKWIAEEKFYSNCRNKIEETKQKIVEQYHSSLNRGRASNSFAWILINEYAECITLLETNNLIYDQYQEFYQLNKIFVEGLFASHAIESPYNSRLDSFSDWILRQLIFNGDSEHIIKTARRYNLKKLDYSNEDSIFSLKKLSHNFFEKTDFWHLYKDNQIHNVHFFVDYYNRIHSNLLVILGLAELDKRFINALIPSILKFHSNNEVIKWHKIKYFKYLIHKKKDVLTLKNLTLIFKSVLYTKKYHDENLIETISDIIESRGKKISITKNNFEQIIRMCFEECPECEKHHTSDTIVTIFRIIKSENYRLKIKEKIIEKLNEKFDFNLYYHAQIYDVLEHDESLFNIALKSSIPDKIKKRPQVFIFDETPIYRPLNHIINLCFKNDFNLNQEPFIQARSLSDYYNWLLDMDNFDYDKFIVAWITEYPTKFYFRRMAGCNQLKETIEKYLKGKIDSQIERFYLNIYVRRYWEQD